MLFGKKSNSKKEQTACCEASSGTRCGEARDGIYCVRVLGAGCKSCHVLYENTKAAVKSAGLDVKIEYVTDMEKIMAYGAMSMPALVLNETIVSAGRVLKSSEIKKLLKQSGLCITIN